MNRRYPLTKTGLARRQADWNERFKGWLALYINQGQEPEQARHLATAQARAGHTAPVQRKTA